MFHLIFTVSIWFIDYLQAGTVRGEGEKYCLARLPLERNYRKGGDYCISGRHILLSKRSSIPKSAK